MAYKLAKCECAFCLSLENIISDCSNKILESSRMICELCNNPLENQGLCSCILEDKQLGSKTSIHNHVSRKKFIKSTREVALLVT